MRDIFSFHLTEIIPVWFVFPLCAENIHILIQLFFRLSGTAVKHATQREGIC